MRIIGIFLALVILFPAISLAEEVHNEVAETLRARVVKIISEQDVVIPGTDTKGLSQEIELEVLSGNEEGKLVRATNDFIKLEVSDVVFVNHIITIEGRELWTVLEPDRRGALLALVFLFVLSAIVLAGRHGLRAVIALALSVLIILYGFLPSILSNTFSPLILSIVFGIIILSVSMIMTHGFGRETKVALIGTTGGIISAGLLASLAIPFIRLTGFETDESVFLNFAKRGTLDMANLLLGAIIIGMLGILDDVSITQAEAVNQIDSANKDLSRKELWTKAYAVGKHHIGSLINTLSLAYIGASLPLMLLFSLSDTSPLILVNREVIATEIVRMLLGSIGLMLTVPITTFVAVYIAKKDKK